MFRRDTSDDDSYHDESLMFSSITSALCSSRSKSTVTMTRKL